MCDSGAYLGPACLNWLASLVCTSAIPFEPIQLCREAYERIINFIREHVHAGGPGCVPLLIGHNILRAWDGVGDYCCLWGCRFCLDHALCRGCVRGVGARTYKELALVVQRSCAFATQQDSTLALRLQGLTCP